MAIRVTASQAKAMGFKASKPKAAGMNRTERKYADILTIQQKSGQIRGFQFEARKFRIGPEGERCWYTPDFIVVLPDGREEVHEVKGGFIRDDARVKLLACANAHPWIRFKLAVFKEGSFSVREI